MRKTFFPKVFWYFMIQFPSLQLRKPLFHTFPITLILISAELGPFICKNCCWYHYSSIFSFKLECISFPGYSDLRSHWHYERQSWNNWLFKGLQFILLLHNFVTHTTCSWVSYRKRYDESIKNFPFGDMLHN